MRIVAAVGGNALLERGEPPDAEIQQRHIRTATDALAPLARSGQLLVTHGNGPQVGLLARESTADPALTRPYPLDVLGAQTQGMIGYWLVQALQNALPGRQVACLVSQTLVSAADPAARPVLGGFCWRLNLDGTKTPTLFRFGQGHGGGIVPVPYAQWPSGGVMQVEGTGAACLLIHRSVLETVRDKTGDRAAPWFRESDSAPGQLLGEDLTFCLRCAAADIPVHVHTGVRVGHVKSQII